MNSSKVIIEKKEPPCALFFFAHQDDEFGAFQLIRAEQDKGHRAICVYFTTGVANGGASDHRNNESLNVLSRMNVSSDDIFFSNDYLSIKDVQLSEHLKVSAEWLDSWLSKFLAIAAVYVPAWEGGHPDHDSLHAISVQIFHERGMVDLVRQFPLYNRYRCVGPFFKVLFPLSENGAVMRTRIPLYSRLVFLRHCLRYPSQFKSWIGIFPFVVFHYLLNGCQESQCVNIARILERPHSGTLYYEERHFASWLIIRARIYDWLEARKTEIYLKDNPGNQ